MLNISFKKATEADAKFFVEIQNKAFYDDFKKYGLCPGYGRSEESLTQSIHTNQTYKIMVNEKIVGKISAKPMNEQNWHIGCLCIIPEYQNQGIGKRAIAFIEQEMPKVHTWVLETPADNVRNIGFYQSCGFFIDRQMNDGILLVVLKKELI